LDPHIAPYFGRPQFDRFKNGILTKRPMAAMIVGIPAVTYAAGLFTHRTYFTGTGALALQAAAHGFIITTALKAVTGRRFPVQIPDGGNFRDTWLKYSGPAHDPGSFPSTHAASAFAVAAVYSTRYNKRWVPVVAYGLASLASFSRITDQTHFPSDVFFGAAAGYAIGHFIVAAPH
jgi:membrane-associated phospholipid phosphatase